MPSSLFPHLAHTSTNTHERNAADEPRQKPPPGIVLDKDGKPCRTCTSSAAWLSMMKSASSTSADKSSFHPNAQTTSPTTILPSTPDPSTQDPSLSQSNCPPDVDQLGRSTWTLLHTLTATYPATPSPQQQSQTKSFLHLFADLYPCWVCADDFKSWMSQPRNAPALSDQEEFGRWMCRAHNAVNVKLGKKEFDCGLWRQRWKDGWKDGSCG